MNRTFIFLALASPLLWVGLGACAKAAQETGSSTGATSGTNSATTNGAGGGTTGAGGGATTGSGGSGKPNGCGDSLELCGGLCVDVASDSEHCGGCGKTCDGGQACVAGKCGAACGAPLVTCGGKCADTQNDPLHCGACDNACGSAPGANAVCLMGSCDVLCQGGLEDCDANMGNGCETDVSSSVAHCGACGSACPAVANGTPQCQGGACKPLCSVGYDDCDKNIATGCEANLKSDAMHCSACGKACAGGEQCIAGVCKVQLFNWQVLEQKDIVYAGHAFLLLKVAYLSANSATANWCQDYTNLCASFGYKPTGCGTTYTSMNNGYGACASQYQSTLPDNSLGCNPSGSISSAAQQNGYNDATGSNSFGFHYCDANSCMKTMCSGQYCNAGLSYFDYSQPHGYTLCKK